ncbi:MAG: class I SAM-dependent methyltransferase, partial [Gammaproteobacteria bacterium]
MTDKSQQMPAVVDKQERRLDRLLRKQILKRLQQLPEGRIHLLEDGEVTTFGQATGQTDLEARITVLHPAFYRALGFGGSNGAAEAYMDGHWECDDLTKLIRIMARNRQVMDTLEGGSAWIVNQMNKGWHWFNRNTADGSRRNIAAHYDLGNQLFERVLDDTMMYSCAVFEQPEDDLARASRNKLDRICRKLQLHPGDDVVEIGTGWGGFALHAAEHFGCHVTTTTISQEQYNYTKQRVAARGLQDRITLLLKDYRELSGQFDKLVSIEMVEA